MNLTKETQSALKSIAKELYQWLKFYKKTLAPSPEIIAQKEVIEDALRFIISTLNAKKQSTTVDVPEGYADPMMLQWMSLDKWQTSLSPFIIKFWTAFKLDNFDKTKITAKAYFFFEGQKTEPVLTLVNEWESNNYQCFCLQM